MIDRSRVIPPDKLKDVLITRTAIKTFQSEIVVEKIISHQFNSVREALRNRREVEITDFGKFWMSPTKVRSKVLAQSRRLTQLQKAVDNNDLSSRKKEQSIRKIEYLLVSIKNLNRKMGKEVEDES